MAEHVGSHLRRTVSGLVAGVLLVSLGGLAACTDRTDDPSAVATPGPQPPEDVAEAPLELPGPAPGPTPEGRAPNVELSEDDDDVGPELQAQLQALPDGATAVLPPGRYRIGDTTVAVSGHRGLTVEGNGAVFFSDEPPTVESRRVFEFREEVDLTVRDLVYEGPNERAGTPGSFDASLEGAHGIALIGVRRTLIEDSIVSNTFGDGILIRDDGGSGRRSRFVTIRRVHIASAGRQGVAITDASDVLIEDSRFEHATLKNLDIEPERTQRVERVTFRSNTIGESGSFAWGANAHGGTIVDVELTENVLHSLAWGFPGNDDGNRRRFAVRDNTGLRTREVIVNARGDTLPVEVLLPIHHVAGVEVSGNTQPLAEGQRFASFEGSTDVVADEVAGTVR